MSTLVEELILVEELTEEILVEGEAEVPDGATESSVFVDVLNAVLAGSRVNSNFPVTPARVALPDDKLASDPFIVAP
jgi:hypothetical protein